MATNNPRKILEKVRNETECCICTETYTDPRVLPCNHTFCLKCLNSDVILMRKYPGQRMACPICRQEFTIPLDGLTALQKNFFMERLVEMTDIRKPSSAGGNGGGVGGKTEDLCEACLEGTDPDSSNTSVPYADMFCVDCRQKLCDECTVHHRKNKMTKLHSVVPNGSQPSPILLQQFVPRICEIHQKECLLFCENCSEVVCPLCFVEKHPFHKGLDAQKHLTDFATKIKDQVNVLSGILVETEKKKEKLEEVKDEFNSKVKLAKQRLTERGQELKELVDQNMKKLNQKIDSLVQQHLVKINVQEEDFEELISEIESYFDYCSNIASVVSANEVNETLHNINETINHLKTKHQIQMDIDISCPGVSFKANDLELFFTGERNILGEIEASTSVKTNTESRSHEDENTSVDLRSDEIDLKAAEINGAAKFSPFQCDSDKETKSKGKDDAGETIGIDSWTLWETVSSSNEEGELGSYLSHPTFLRCIRTKASRQQHRLIMGITVLDDRLCVVHQNDSFITCYDVHSFEFDEELLVDELINPRDIVSSIIDDCFYVLDETKRDGNCIYYIVKADPSGRAEHRWCVGKNCSALSVSHGGDVIVPFENRNVVKIYSSDGRLISELTIELDLFGTGFQHAVEIEEDRLLICYNKQNDDCGMCLVDRNSGDIINRFTDCDDVVGVIQSPMSFTVDEDANVLVSDKFRRRVLLFSSDLKIARELLTDNNRIRYPDKMYLDRINGRLFLIDDYYNRRKEEYKDSRILVFDVKHQ